MVKFVLSCLYSRQLTCSILLLHCIHSLIPFLPKGPIGRRCFIVLGTDARQLLISCNQSNLIWGCTLMTFLLQCSNRYRRRQLCWWGSFQKFPIILIAQLETHRRTQWSPSRSGQSFAPCSTIINVTGKSIAAANADAKDDDAKLSRVWIPVGSVPWIAFSYLNSLDVH